MCLWAGALEDMYWYAQTLYHTGQFHRAATLLCSRKLDKVGFFLDPQEYQFGLLLLVIVISCSWFSINCQNHNNEKVLHTL